MDIWNKDVHKYFLYLILSESIVKIFNNKRNITQKYKQCMEFKIPM